MSNAKVVMGQAANTLTAPLNVEDVFSTYLHTGTGAAKSIVNGIDLSGEGGLVWSKGRSSSRANRLIDTERGVTKTLRSDATLSEETYTDTLTSFNSDGFTLGADASSDSFNRSSNTYASWTFRKAPKFFDVVTWTGDGTTGRAISHNLGCEVGTIFVKSTNGNSNWYVYNRNLTSANYGLKLNGTDAQAVWGNGNVTDTTFSFDHQNSSNNTYVAYLFAHNDGDGGFNGGDIIKCGTYEGNGGTQEIDLGFEPQWVMIKNIESRSYQAALDWNIFDNMREWANRTSGDNDVLIANESDAETALARCFPTANGFAFYNDGAYSLNTSGDTYIYIAIRRGTKVPESATEVFAIDTAGGTSPTPPTFVSGFPVDFSFYKNVTDSSNNWGSQNRLTGDADLAFNTTSAEFSNGGSYWQKDYMNGIGSNTGTNSNGYQWMWKRAPGFFDAVAYTGDNATSHAIDHNLGVVPEMMWCKSRDISKDWNVYHSGLGTSGGNQGYLGLNLTNAAAYNTERFAAAPTSTQFIVGNNSRINSSGSFYIAYLFASLPGISKVGSYTGTGATLNIDCGFTSGARFVLIKKTDEAKDWVLFDTLRGIVAGNDDYLLLNKTDANNAGNADFIDPYSAGFSLTGVSSLTNDNGGNYIFYAIA